MYKTNITYLFVRLFNKMDKSCMKIRDKFYVEYKEEDFQFLEVTKHHTQQRLEISKRDLTTLTECSRTTHEGGGARSTNCGPSTAN